MHLTFIKPKIGHLINGTYIDEGRMEPLQIGVLAGLTPDDVEIAFYDDRLEEIPYERPTDLVAITVETFTAKRAYDIARRFRQQHQVPVIMGGMHPTLVPEEVLKQCDSICQGDAEAVWPQIIADFKLGRLKRSYFGATTFSDTALNSFAPSGRALNSSQTIGAPIVPQGRSLPRRGLFKGKGYLPITLMQFSRGCPFTCTFCATSAYFQARHYCRSAAAVIEEIEAQERRLIFFVDDNFTANRQAAKELLTRLVPLGIKWVGQLSIDIAEDREMVDLLAKSGCLGFVVGFESISMENLNWMDKRQNASSYNNYVHQIKLLQDKGFQLWAAFTFGHDFDTTSSLEDTIAFALKHRFSFAAFNTLLPYPNTPLFNQLQRENRLLYDSRWWLHDDYRFNRAAFIPKQMSPEQLTALGTRARKEFNSIKGIIRRAFHLKTNMRSLFRLAIFLRYSLLFKKEVKKKEGMLLGGVE